MEDKGLVRHDLDGRAFIYAAQFSRDESTGRFLEPSLRRGGVGDGAEPVARRTGVGLGIGTDPGPDRRGAAEERTAVSGGETAMSGTTASGWLPHTLAGRGAVAAVGLDVGGVDAAAGAAAALAESAVAASLLLAVLSLGPAWLVVTTPAPVVPAVAAVQPHGGAPAPPAPALPPVTNFPPAPTPFVATPRPAPAEPAPHDPAAPAPIPAPSRWKYFFASVVGLGLRPYRVAGGRTVPRRGAAGSAAGCWAGSRCGG